MHEVVTSTILSHLGIAHTAQTQEPYFRGWFNPVEPPQGQIGYIVQWLPKAENDRFRKCAYVELPSLNSGIVAEGFPIRPGSERLTAFCSFEDMSRMMVEGMKRLKEVISSEGAANAA